MFYQPLNPINDRGRTYVTTVSTKQPKHPSYLGGGDEESKGTADVQNVEGATRKSSRKESM